MERHDNAYADGPRHVHVYDRRRGSRAIVANPPVGLVSTCGSKMLSLDALSLHCQPRYFHAHRLPTYKMP